MNLRGILRRALQVAGLVPQPPDYLGQQVARSWAKESRNLTWFGLRDGMSVLDLGCGPGHFTERLTQLLPQATITALDSESRMLDAARRRLGTRASIVHAPAHDTGLPDASFDFIVARLLFQHLPQPEPVLRECRRLLKPGGRLAIIDVDDDLFGLTAPRVPGLKRLLGRYGRAQTQRGGNRRIGRSLVRLLRDAGFTETQLECVAVHSDESGLDAVFPQLDPMPLQSLLAQGQLTRAEHDALRAAREAFLAHDPFALALLFMACGRRA
ncbi:MAG TPA: methyltransferase domain-containing protein [Thermoanaerobaculia bacterium]|nr:methyltransferase domain-containing protein [Thermoanaerobaculia bacterium]